jgi:hypothetical protein
MATPYSGTISFADLQNEIGGKDTISLNDYYRGSYNLGAKVGDAGAVPTSGLIKLSDFYAIPKNLTYSQGSSPLVTNNGNPSGTYYLNILPYLIGKQRDRIDTFKITTLPTAGSFWPWNPPVTASFRVGTSGSTTSPRYDKRSTFRVIAYDGNSTLSLRSYYSGGSTDFKTSGAWVSKIAYA